MARRKGGGKKKKRPSKGTRSNPEEVSTKTHDFFNSAGKKLRLNKDIYRKDKRCATELAEWPSSNI